MRTNLSAGGEKSPMRSRAGGGSAGIAKKGGNLHDRSGRRACPRRRKLSGRFLPSRGSRGEERDHREGSSNRKERGYYWEGKFPILNSSMQQYLTSPEDEGKKKRKTGL